MIKKGNTIHSICFPLWFSQRWWIKTLKIIQKVLNLPEITRSHAHNWLQWQGPSATKYLKHKTASSAINDTMTPQPYNAHTFGWTFYRLLAPKSLLLRTVFSIAWKDHLNHRQIRILWNLSRQLEIPVQRGLHAVCFWHFCQKHVHQ